MPTLNDEIRNVVPGDDFTHRVRVTLEVGQSIDEAWDTVKESEGYEDIDALFQKHITTLYVPGQGQIEDDGAVTHLAVLRFDWSPQDTAKLRFLRRAPYFGASKIVIQPGDIENTPWSGLIYPAHGVTKAHHS